MHLQADECSFSVEFSGMDLSASQQLLYRFRLQGFEQDWQYSDASQRLASYTNLWPGEYTLQVQATYALVRVRNRVAQLQARALTQLVQERSQQLKLAQKS
jgi:hypothetical protein